jgi:4-oxalocrotonate tautomerase
MPIVTVQMMEGVLSAAQKKQLMKGITDAVVKVYGGPMRLFMNVVIQEVKDGDWIATGDVVTSARVRKISPNVRAAGAPAPPAPAAARRARTPRARAATRRASKV